MKGLSLTQPWATLVAIRAKRFETRSWSATYRGELLIHAAKKFPPECHALCRDEPFRSVLLAAGIEHTRQLPTGAIVAHVPGVLPVQRTEDMPGIWERMRALGPFPDGSVLPPFEESSEFAFGDYGPHRYAWPLPYAMKLREPVPCKGALGLWAVPQVVLDLIAGQGVLD